MFIKILDKWVNVNHIENIAVHPSKREATFAMDDLAKKINKDLVSWYNKKEK